VSENAKPEEQTKSLRHQEDAAQDVSPYSARSFITIDKSLVHLTKGFSENVTATIRIPSNVGVGGRYAIVYIHSAPIGGGTTSIVTAITVPILITIKGGGSEIKGSKGEQVERPAITADRLLDLLSRADTEPSENLDSHRRGHWFKSSIAHHAFDMFVNDVPLVPAGVREVIIPYAYQHEQDE
jgi:hypothetical protein